MIKQSSKIFVSINDPGNLFSLNTNTQEHLLGTGKKTPCRWNYCSHLSMPPGIKLPQFHLFDYCSYSASMLHWWRCENWTESSQRPTSRLSLLMIWIFLSSGRMTKKSIWVARVEPFCYHSFTSPTLCRPRPTVSDIAIGESCASGQKILYFFLKLSIIIWWKLSRAWFGEINQLLCICSSNSPLLK